MKKMDIFFNNISHVIHVHPPPLLTMFICKIDAWDLCKTGTLNVHSWAIKVIVNRRLWIIPYYDEKKNEKKTKKTSYLKVKKNKILHSWDGNLYITLMAQEWTLRVPVLHKSQASILQINIVSKHCKDYNLNCVILNNKYNHYKV
jgi:hypothetical protein